MGVQFRRVPLQMLTSIKADTQLFFFVIIWRFELQNALSSIYVIIGFRMSQRRSISTYIYDSRAIFKRTRRLFF